MPKENKKNTASSSTRHAPLGQVIIDAENTKKYASRSTKPQNQTNLNSKNKGFDDDDYYEDKSGDKGEFLDVKQSKRILEMSRLQVEEEVFREFQSGSNTNSSAKAGWKNVNNNGKGNKNKKVKKKKNTDDSSDEDQSDVEQFSDDEDDDGDNAEFPKLGLQFKTKQTDGYINVEGYNYDDEGDNEDENNTISNAQGNRGNRRTLADMIMDKIAEKEAGLNANNEANGSDDDDDEYAERRTETGKKIHRHDTENLFPDKVVKVYTEIGVVLSRYSAGKLPKAFKVIPSLKQWEDVLSLTNPSGWSPMAMYQATRIFASNLNPRMAQRFYNIVLLEACRSDIKYNKKLNYHYYASLKKALYKPAAFFKGILLPLSRTNCTLREAAIFSSLLQKCSIPVSHASVALHKLASPPTSGMSGTGIGRYSQGGCLFIRTLIDKKYSLPLPVIHGLVGYFTSWPVSSQGLNSAPVLWHQALLVFVQRYKENLSLSEKEGLGKACKEQFHHMITREVRWELFGAKGWKGEVDVGGVKKMEM